MSVCKINNYEKACATDCGFVVNAKARVNYGKTKGLWTGSRKGRRTCPMDNIKWTTRFFIYKKLEIASSSRSFLIFGPTILLKEFLKITFQSDL